MDKKTLDFKETISFLGMTRKQILWFVRNGNLKYIDVGQGQVYPRYRFLVSELERFLINIQKTI